MLCFSFIAKLHPTCEQFRHTVPMWSAMIHKYWAFLHPFFAWLVGFLVKQVWDAFIPKSQFLNFTAWIISVGIFLRWPNKQSLAFHSKWLATV